MERERSRTGDAQAVARGNEDESERSSRSEGSARADDVSERERRSRRKRVAVRQPSGGDQPRPNPFSCCSEHADRVCATDGAAANGTHVSRRATKHAIIAREDGRATRHENTLSRRAVNDTREDDMHRQRRPRSELACASLRKRPILSLINGCRNTCLLYTSPSPRDQRGSRMPSSA